MFTADGKGLWMTPFLSDRSINISSGLCADGILVLLYQEEEEFNKVSHI